jgi:hypothetical protein
MSSQGLIELSTISHGYTTGFLVHLNSYEIFTELVNSSSDLNRFVTGK